MLTKQEWSERLPTLLQKKCAGHIHVHCVVGPDDHCAEAILQLQSNERETTGHMSFNLPLTYVCISETHVRGSMGQALLS